MIRFRLIVMISLVALGPAFLGAACTCSRRSEPDKNPAYNPTSPDALAAPPPPPNAGFDAGMTEKEARDWRIRIEAPMCNKIAEHTNALSGKGPTDPNRRAINQISKCLTHGNVAWYKCQLDAQTPDETKTCDVRFLRPPE